MLESVSFENSIESFSLSFKHTKLNQFYDVFSEHGIKQKYKLFSFIVIAYIFVIGVGLYVDFYYTNDNDLDGSFILYICYSFLILGISCELITTYFKSMKVVRTIPISFGIFIGFSIRSFNNEINKYSSFK